MLNSEASISAAGNGFPLPASYDTKEGRTAANPLYCFDSLMATYEQLLAPADDESDRADRVALVLEDVEKRLELGLLYPRHLEAGQLEQAEARIAQVLHALSPEEICTSPVLDEYNKASLLQRCAYVDGALASVFAESDAQVALVDGFVWHTAVPTVVVERCRFEGGMLRLRGRFICPAFLFIDKPSFDVVFNGQSQRIELGPSSYCYASSRTPNAHTWGFECELDVAARARGSVRGQISFAAAFDGVGFARVNIAFAPRIHNAQRADALSFFDGLVLEQAASNRLDYRTKRSLSDRLALRSYKRANPQHAEIRTRVQDLLSRMGAWSGKRVWVYTDFPTQPAGGNALDLLLADCARDDGIERVYISNDVQAAERTYPQLAGHVFARSSDEFTFFSLRAELVFASYLERFTFCAFSEAELAAAGDLCAPQRRIYLQHGVAHAHMPWYLSYDRNVFDYVVASAGFEQANLHEVYAWPAHAVLPCGMPRFDALVAASAAGVAERPKRVLLAPSWRNYLVEGTPEERESNESAFAASGFYQGIRAFVDAFGASSLPREGWELALKLHPHFACYRHLFDFDLPGVSVLDAAPAPDDQAVVVTDYSSYVFDFVYAGTPVVYFLPDAVEFSAGLGTYSSLEWPLEEGFGPYCTEANDALAAVEALAHDTVPDGKREQYAQRRAGLFLHEDGCNRERIYEAACGIARALRGSA